MASRSGEEEVSGAKRAYGWPEDAQFLVPDGVREHVAGTMGKRGGGLHAQWDAMFDRYRREQAELSEQLDFMRFRELPPGWDTDIPTFPADAKGIATPRSSRQGAERHAPSVPWLVGGAADLAPSTKTKLIRGRRSHSSRQLRRPQHAFRHPRARHGRIVNGMACRTCALRLHLPHLQRLHEAGDAARGADGAARHLHLHPRFHRPRRRRPDPPADRAADDPARHARHAGAAALRRQRDGGGLARGAGAEGPAGGAGALAPGGADAGPQEVRPGRCAVARRLHPRRRRATSARGDPDRHRHRSASLPRRRRAALAEDGIGARVVSMPCWELFERQDEAYRDAVLPPRITARVAVEAGAALGWDRYAGPTARSSPCTASAPRARRRRSTRSSASPRRRWRKRRATRSQRPSA